LSTDPTFTPSAEFQVVADGPRDLALVFIGASLVAGVGDPKGQGWVSRVVGRTHHPELELSAYNLGVRGDTSADVLARWRTECPPRWSGRTEKRLVLSVGTADAVKGVTLARHRLNLANILDDAASAGIGVPSAQRMTAGSGKIGSAHAGHRESGVGHAILSAETVSGCASAAASATVSASRLTRPYMSTASGVESSSRTRSVTGVGSFANTEILLISTARCTPAAAAAARVRWTAATLIS